MNKTEKVRQSYEFVMGDLSVRGEWRKVHSSITIHGMATKYWNERNHGM